MFANREHEDPHPPSSRRNPDGDPGRAAAAPGRGAARTRPGTIDRLVAGQSAPGADGSRGAGRVAARAGGAPRSEERRGGEGGGRKGRLRWSPAHKKKKQKAKN